MAYNYLRTVKTLSAGDMSGPLLSAPIEIKLQDNVGIQLHWTTANAIGGFDVQVSADHNRDINGNVLTAGSWVSVPISPTISVQGVSDDAYIDLNQLSAAYIRVVYTPVSGSGLLDVFVTGKAV